MTTTQPVFVFQAEDSIRDATVTGVQTCALPISFSIIDYTQAQRILTEKAKSCPAGAEPCLGGPGDEGHSKPDLRAAIDCAYCQLLQRDAQVTLLFRSAADIIEARQIQRAYNRHKSRSF